MCAIGLRRGSSTLYHALHLKNKKFIAERKRVSYIFSNRTANLALRAIIDCNISRAVCATQHSIYLCDLPRAILKRYLLRRNKLIYLSIYLRSGSLYARALTFCIMYRASARIIFRCWYVRASKITAICSLPTRRVSSSRHCMLRPFATHSLVATGNRTMFLKENTSIRLVPNMSNVSVSRFPKKTLSS